MLTSSKIDRLAFREAMSHLPAAVYVVTSDGPAGRRGVTVTSACSVSDEPPMLLVCLNNKSPDNERFVRNGCFAVNLLAERHQPLSRAFSGEGRLSPAERFGKGEWDMLVTGAPTLCDAIASFDCRLRETQVVATHRILFGEVVGLRTGHDDAPLLYRGRGYTSLPRA